MNRERATRGGVGAVDQGWVLLVNIQREGVGSTCKYTRGGVVLLVNIQGEGWFCL